MQLKRQISALGLLLLIINGTIGSAWLFTPYYAAKIAGPGVFISWLLGGMMMICVALCFADSSAKIPLAGGTTEIAKFTHGEFMGFIISWIAWLSNITVPAVEVQSVLQYASNYIPSLTHRVDGTPVLSHIGIFSAVVLMITLIFINCYSIKSTIRSNMYILIFKISIIGLTIFAILATYFNPHNFYLNDAQNVLDSWKNILTALADGGIAFALVGFKHGVELAGEATTPSRTVPIAVVGSVVVCLLIYLGLQFAFIGSLSSHTLASGWKHLSFSGDIGPFAGIATGLGMVWLAKCLMVDAVVSPLGAGSVYISSTARITYAMAKNNFLPAFLSKLNRSHIPGAAIIFNSMIACLLFLPFPSWQKMVGFLTSLMLVSYAMGPLSVHCLKDIPQLNPSAFKMPFVKFITSSVFYFCNLVIYWSGWDTVAKSTFAIVVGILLFFISKLLTGSSKTLSLRAAIWFFPYLLGLLCISYVGAFGGKNILPFGFDFLVIWIFSMLSFYWAVASGIVTQSTILDLNFSMNREAQ